MMSPKEVQELDRMVDQAVRRQLVKQASVGVDSATGDDQTCCSKRIVEQDTIGEHLGRRMAEQIEQAILGVAGNVTFNGATVSSEPWAETLRRLEARRVPDDLPDLPVVVEGKR